MCYVNSKAKKAPTDKHGLTIIEPYAKNVLNNDWDTVNITPFMIYIKRHFFYTTTEIL